MVTSLCVDELRKQWACVGTDTGRLVLWDIRFQLPINVCVHPSGKSFSTCDRKIFLLNVAFAEKPFYRLWWHPTHHSRILTSVMGRGEVGDWDLETGTRTAVIWPDNSPALSYQDEVTLI